MDSPLLLVTVVLGLGAVYVVPLVVLEAYSRYRGAVAVICPGTGQSAAVRMDARRAAWTAAFGRPRLRIVGCSRWPEHGGCDRGCLNRA